MGQQSARLQRLSRGSKVGTRKSAKYRNKKVEWQGMKFDSIREFERYQELHILEKAKKISGLIHQHRIKLSCGGVPVLSKKGRQLSYIVDFTYWDYELDRQRFEDVKGYNTPLGDLKIAVVEAETGNEIEIVR